MRASSRPSPAERWSDPTRDTVERWPASRYLASVRNHALLVAAIVGVALLVAGIYVSTADSRYTAHAQIVVNPLPADGTTFLGIGGLIRDSATAEPVVTAAQLLDSAQVRQAVSAALGRDGSTSFRVTPLGQSNVVDVAATSSTSEKAARAANVYAGTALHLRERVLQRELTDAISRLQSRLAVTGGGGADSAVNAQITQRLAQLNSLVGSPDPTLALLGKAAPPASASWPRTKESLLVALLCGLLLGAIVAILVDRLDRTARHPRDLAGAGGSPRLFRLPHLPDNDLQRYVSGSMDGDARYRDSFRGLRSAFRGADRGAEASPLVAVCSVDRNDGRTSTAVGFAKAFADADRRVVLVDGDMRRAGATSALGATVALGTLPAVLRNPSALRAALVELAPNLWLLPAARDADAADAVASGRLELVLDALRDEFDLVVVDAPPFADGADADAFSEGAEAVLLCARLGHTDRAAFRETVHSLREAGSEPLLVVVDDADDRAGRTAWAEAGRRLPSDVGLRLGQWRRGALETRAWRVTLPARIRVPRRQPRALRRPADTP